VLRIQTVFLLHVMLLQWCISVWLTAENLFRQRRLFSRCPRLKATIFFAWQQNLDADVQCYISGLSNWQPAGCMRPSDQLSAAGQDVLTYFNFWKEMFKNVFEILPGGLSQFLSLQVMGKIELSYKRMFRKDVSAEWFNISSMKVCW
jgi:hypothetical protein